MVYPTFGLSGNSSFNDVYGFQFLFFLTVTSPSTYQNPFLTTPDPGRPAPTLTNNLAVNPFMTGMS
jgi:hypothetical protein